MIPTIIAPMEIDHLDHIMEIEQVAFPTHWSRAVFKRELTTNKNGHYWTIQPDNKLPIRTVGKSNKSLAEPPPAILCYGGFWLLGEEAHIVSVATHPQWRQRGLAKKLMLVLLDKAILLGATEVTLEVRTSNIAARALYGNLGFIEVGRRKNYYPPTEKFGESEDALILTRKMTG